MLVPDLADLASAGRWPLFAPAAVAATVAAVFAFPLTLGAHSLDVLEIHRDADSALTPDEIADVVHLADTLVEQFDSSLNPAGRRTLPAPGRRKARPRNASADGQSVQCHDLRAEPQRWPRFSLAAVRLGFAAVDVVPMRLRGEVIGTLNLFRTSPGELLPGTAALAQSFANVATISLLQVRAIDVADAFSLVRTCARNTNQLLSDVAAQVNARSPEIAGLTRINQPRSRW